MQQHLCTGGIAWTRMLSSSFHHGSRKTGIRFPTDPQHQHEPANYQAEISWPPQICDGKTAMVIPISCHVYFALIGWLESKTKPLSSPCRRTKCITLNHQFKISILLFCETTCSSLALCGASHHVYLSAFTQLVNQWGSLILTWLIIAKNSL